MHSFELVSGLKVNFSNSNLHGINVMESFLGPTSTFLHCFLGSIPFKFLGLPIGDNPRRCNTWEPVVATFRKRLALWKGKQLSLGGRITLITSVLSSLPLYFFFFYKAPRIILNNLMGMQRKFL